MSLKGTCVSIYKQNKLDKSDLTKMKPKFLQTIEIAFGHQAPNKTYHTSGLNQH